MNNVIKNTLVWTGVYFVYCTLVMLFMVTVQIFWKPVLFMFCVIFALFTFDHYSKYPSVLTKSPKDFYNAYRAKFV